MYRFNELFIVNVHLFHRITLHFFCQIYRSHPFLQNVKKNKYKISLKIWTQISGCRVEFSFFLIVPNIFSRLPIPKTILLLFCIDKESYIFLPPGALDLDSISCTMSALIQSFHSPYRKHCD